MHAYLKIINKQVINMMIVITGTRKGDWKMDKMEIGEVFTITDDSNEEQEVEILATMTLENNNYAAVGFVEDLHDENEDDIDVFFLKIEEDGSFSALNNDEEFDKVSQAFDEMMDEEDDVEE